MSRPLIVMLIVAALLAPQPLPAAPMASAERQAFRLAQQALQHYKALQYAHAAALYLRAHALQPQTLEYLYGAARSELAAGQAEAARGHFAQVCQAAGAAHPLCVRGQRSLAQAGGAGSPTPVAPAQAPTPSEATELALTLPPTPELEAPPPLVGRTAPAVAAAAPPRWWAWSAIGLAGAGAALGASLAAVAAGDQRDLDAKRMADGRFDLAQVSYAEARAAQQGINNAWWGAGAAAVVSVLSAALAGYLLREPGAPPAGSAAP